MVFALLTFVVASTFAFPEQESKNHTTSHSPLGIKLDNHNRTTFNLVFSSSGYHITSHERLPIRYGEPVHWQINFSNGSKQRQLNYETPKIRSEQENIRFSSFWVTLIRFFSNSTTPYQHLPYSFSPPEATMMDTDADIENLSITTESVDFILPSLNRTRTVVFSEINASPASIVTENHDNKTYILTTSQGTPTESVVDNTSLSALLDEVDPEKQLLIQIFSPHQLSEKTMFFLWDKDEGEKLFLDHELTRNNTFVTINISSESLELIDSSEKPYLFYGELERSNESDYAIENQSHNTTDNDSSESVLNETILDQDNISDNKTLSLTTNISDRSYARNDSLKINLHSHFSITESTGFEITSDPKLDAEMINNKYLLARPEFNKTYDVTVYASDKHDLIRSNKFKIYPGKSSEDNSSLEKNKKNNTVLLEFNDTKMRFPESALSKMDPELVKKLSQPNARTENTIRLLVNRTTTGGEKQDVATLNATGAHTKHEPIRNVQGYEVMEVDAEGFSDLLNSTGVSSLKVDSPVKAFTSETLELTNFTAVHNLTNNTGAGAKVCVLDTGVSVRNLDLTPGDDIFGYNFVNDTEDYADNNGHGTKVMYSLVKSAPDATYHMAKVLDGEGVGYSSDVVAGLEWCASQDTGIITMSLGEGMYEGYCDSTLVASKVNELASQGILVVAATGNDANTTAISNPACAQEALPVSASMDSSSLWTLSNYNNATLLSAPGAGITSLDERGNEVLTSGTSLSAAFVAGGAALVHANDSSLQPRTIKERLIHTGSVFTHEKRAFAQIDVWNAVHGITTNNLSIRDLGSSYENDSMFTAQAEPVVQSAEIYTIDGKNLTTSDIHANYTVSDSDGDHLFNTTDWRVNDISIAVLNTPFNINYTGADTDGVRDLTTHSNNGTLGGGSLAAIPGWKEDCVLGGCYELDGSDDYIDYGDETDFENDTMTISLWTKLHEIGSRQALISKHSSAAGDREWELSVNASGVVEWNIWDGTGNEHGIVSDNALTAGTWYHIVAVKTNSSLHLYINNAEQADVKTVPETIQKSQARVHVGAVEENTSRPDHFLNGTIDELSLFSRALSSDQIATIYDNQSSGKPPLKINSPETHAGENWSVAVTSSDEKNYSSTYTSNQLTVRSEKEIDIIIPEIYLSKADPVEGEQTIIYVNVTNNASSSTGNFTTELTSHRWNTTAYNLISTDNSEDISLEPNGSQLVEFNWEAKPGSYRFTATADPENTVHEVNETNNDNRLKKEISSWHVFYGNFTYDFSLGDQHNNAFFDWVQSESQGNIFYSDIDSTYNLPDLKPLNGTNDLKEADDALGTNLFNDSLQRTFDKNSDGIADTTRSFLIGGRMVENVPVINSTKNSDFVTGILWDSEDSHEEFTGSQEIIMITSINDGGHGSFGTYDYEARVPVRLRNQTGSRDAIRRHDEPR
ncbi:MAG: S8 family serine peptidase [Candidatus Woesearchaeota archaeon]